MSKVYLAHHGVLGQKWGVRRYQNANGTRIKKASDYGSSEAIGKSDKKTSKKNIKNRRVSALSGGVNAKTKLLIAEDKQKQQKAYKELDKKVDKLEKISQEAFKNGDIATYLYINSRLENANRIAARPTDTAEQIRKKGGSTLVSTKTQKEEFKSKMPKKASDYGLQETVVVKDVPYKEVSSSDRKPITRDSVNALKNDSKSTINSANNLRKIGKNSTDLSKYSDAELQKIVNRQQLEQRYNQMNPDKIDKGASILREGLEVAGGVAGIYATYKWIKQL